MAPAVWWLSDRKDGSINLVSESAPQIWVRQNLGVPSALVELIFTFTQIRATLNHVEVLVERQNITLSIDKDILQKVKILAVKQNTSVSALLTHLLEDIINQQEGYNTASKNHLRLLKQNFDLGTNGSIDYSRDELHAR